MQNTTVGKSLTPPSTFLSLPANIWTHEILSCVTIRDAISFEKVCSGACALSHSVIDPNKWTALKQRYLELVSERNNIVSPDINGRLQGHSKERIDEINKALNEIISSPLKSLFTQPADNKASSVFPVTLSALRLGAPSESYTKKSKEESDHIWWGKVCATVISSFGGLIFGGVAGLVLTGKISAYLFLVLGVPYITVSFLMLTLLDFKIIYSSIIKHYCVSLIISSILWTIFCHTALSLGTPLLV